MPEKSKDLRGFACARETETFRHFVCRFNPIFVLQFLTL